jgi:hypothetical protein
MVIRVHGHHLLLGLRLGYVHKNHLGLYSRQRESVKSLKFAIYKVTAAHNEEGFPFLEVMCQPQRKQSVTKEKAKKLILCVPL